MNTDGVDAPRVPNGDFSDPAIAAREDDAKAEVAGSLEELGVFVVPREANGEVADVFANALVANS